MRSQTCLLDWLPAEGIGFSFQLQKLPVALKQRYGDSCMLKEVEHCSTAITRTNWSNTKRPFSSCGEERWMTVWWHAERSSGVPHFGSFLYLNCSKQVAAAFYCYLLLCKAPALKVECQVLTLFLRLLWVMLQWTLNFIWIFLNLVEQWVLTP